MQDRKMNITVVTLKSHHIVLHTIHIWKWQYVTVYPTYISGGCHSHRPNSHSCDRTGLPVYKGRVESLCILPYTSVNVRVVNSQWLKFNAVNSQSPKISMVNGQNTEKSWSKFWPCGHSCDYRVYGSDTSLHM